MQLHRRNWFQRALATPEYMRCVYRIMRQNHGRIGSFTLALRFALSHWGV